MSKEYDYMIDDFINIIDEYSGKYIIHYMSFQGLKGIIEDKKVWFTRADFLNDVTEGIYIETLYNEIIEEYRKGSKCTQDTISFLKEDFILHEWQDNSKGNSNNLDNLLNELDYNVDIFICSFSLEKDSLPMWNYYGKNERMKGVNIKFSTQCLSDKNKMNIFKVVYDINTQKELIKGAINSLIKYDRSKDRKVFVLARLFFIRLMRNFKYTFKNPCFSHEKEIRLVVRRKKSDLEDIEYRINESGVLIPYIKIPINIINPIITIAPLANYELVKCSLEGFLKKQGVDKFSIMQSKCPIRW